jgi:CRP-like cAMP-binding protein
VHHVPREPLWEPNRPIENVYFPLTAVASILSVDEQGGEIEVGTIGNEGLIGLPVFLGATSAPGRAFTQIEGDYERMDAAEFARLSRSLPSLQEALQLYTQGFLSQVSQSVACNRLHSPEQRLARWLLASADRVQGNRFAMTQDFMGQMLGVRRATVNEAAQALQERQLIRYSRGMIEVLDREGLEATACPCYRIVRDEFDKLFGVLMG